MRYLPILSLPLWMVLGSSCSSAEYALSADMEGEAFGQATDDANYGYEYDEGSFSEPGASEEEDDFLTLDPAQSDIYVFVANPGRDTVTRINVFTHAVDTVDVGVNPSMVLTTSDYTTAVVFNKGDDTVTVLDASTLDAATIEVRDNLNNMVVSPDGQWAALWHDANAVTDDDVPPVGGASFNEVSLVNLWDATHMPMVVGFGPKEILFTDDTATAVVVSDASLALVDLLEEGLPVTTVHVTDDLIDPPEAEEVALAPNGSFAFVRQFGGDELTIVDLDSLTVDQVPCGFNPTDLDISPEGDVAAVVARGSDELYLFDVFDPYASPAIIDLPVDESFGSLTFDPSGRKGILYTNATLTDRYASWDRDTDVVTMRGLEKPVKSVAMSPTGDSLIIFHTLDDAVGADINSPFYNEWALTLIDLNSFLVNARVLPGEVTGYANSNNGNWGYVIMDGQPFMEALDYQTLLPEVIELASDPVHVGVLPDLEANDGDEPPAWVSQEHDLGRMTFYDPDDASLETITGFELASAIED